MNPREEMLANFEEFLNQLSEDELERLSCERFTYSKGQAVLDTRLNPNTFVCSTEGEDSPLWFTEL